MSHDKILALCAHVIREQCDADDDTIRKLAYDARRQMDALVAERDALRAAVQRAIKFTKRYKSMLDVELDFVEANEQALSEFESYSDPRTRPSGRR